MKRVSKNLIGMEDLLTGTGHEEQIRSGDVYRMGKINIPYSVESEIELLKIDTDKHTLAVMLGVLYKYDKDEKNGDIVVPDKGSWVIEPVKLVGLPEYRNNSTAKQAGLTVNTLYKTSSGTLRIVI